MSIFERLQRIVKGNVHDALDRLENPEKILKQRIRELEEAIRSAKDATANFAVSLKKMEKEQEQLKRLRAEWEQTAKKAVGAGDEDLARKALAEKLKMEERIQSLDPSIRNSTDTYKQLRDQLTPLNDQLAEAKLKLAELGSRQQAAIAQQRFGESIGKAGAMAGGGEHFEKMEQQVLQAESAVEIDREMRGAPSDLDDTLAKKARQLQVSAELEALKKEMGK